VKVFHCDHCGALVFFENVKCVSCGHTLAFLPDLLVVGSLEPAAADADETNSAGAAQLSAAKTGADQPESEKTNVELFVSPLAAARGKRYRLCANYTNHDICNWALEEDDPEALCRSCRLTTIVPDASDPEQRTAWYKLEVAKRRLVYSLIELKLPLQTKAEAPDAGLAFEFKTPSTAPGAEPVMTGHDNGLITINTAEADDAQREKLRNQLHEPYRTLLGHFRHEIGHYYWDRLIAGTDRLEAYRELFGNEELDYGEALKKHYENGAPADWQDSFVSTYATSHPWEDWAETWAHYLHMFDTLETAAACGLMLKPRRADEPTLQAPPKPSISDFERMIENWFPLTYALNSLNRGLGQADAYPFVLSAPAIEKLRFVHETINAQS
jgi:hypothetical protein